jgi:hypothetical protein
MRLTKKPSSTKQLARSRASQQNPQSVDLGSHFDDNNVDTLLQGCLLICSLGDFGSTYSLRLDLYSRPASLGLYLDVVLCVGAEHCDQLKSFDLRHGVWRRFGEGCSFFLRSNILSSAD